MYVQVLPQPKKGFEHVYHQVQMEQMIAQERENTLRQMTIQFSKSKRHAYTFLVCCFLSTLVY